MRQNIDTLLHIDEEETAILRKLINQISLLLILCM
jgi:hypothetical protein